ncbi:hypothetical protein A2U01_0000896 [Trifolium medium]|uniref:Reverse transcriptase domain-containing protein n=1 Tax=Trifolium medium TaxID=97028 RepID=A0A392M0M4_9FABA|nr:hypothetical protein [Trifolium medium]
MLEVYMDDMIFKFVGKDQHEAHLSTVFSKVRKFNMWLNPEKCTFGVKAGKFLGFYLNERDIEENPDKCDAILKMETPSSKEQIMKLNGMLTTMKRFISRSAQHALKFYKLLRKEVAFEWTTECEEAFSQLKKALSQPPILSRPTVEETLYLYLAVSSEVVSAVLVREAQAFTDFLAELTLGNNELCTSWTVFTNESSINRGSGGVGLILESGEGLVVEVSLKFVFSATNNKEEYEACITGLNLALEMGAKNLKLHTDSQDQNTRADILARLTSTRNNEVTYSFIQETLERSSTTEKATVCATATPPAEKTWIDLIKDYILKGELPTNPAEATLIKRRAGNRTIIEGQLYRRGLSSLLLKCLAGRETTPVLEEVHKGIASQHLGGRALAKKILRAGYYWPSLVQDSKNFVKNCEKCQKHGDVHIAPPTELNS